MTQARNIGRKPDYNLHAMDKVTDEKSRVGGAWLNDDGSISVKLNPFVTLASTTALVLTLFPASEPSK